MNQFIAELQRRRVIRLAGIYIVVGWVIAQAANMFEESLNLPPWFDAVAVSLLLLGFPIALLLAWAFDMTPEGPERTADDTPGDKRNRLPDFLAIAGIIVVCAALAWQQWSSTDSEAVPNNTVANTNAAVDDTAVADDLPRSRALDPASIAVLPFIDLSPESDQEYFTDGLSEELLNVLVRIDGLRVASRTSSFQFKGRDIGVPAIADELQVRHILEGSVRKSGDTIRVTAQLIDGQNDEHLWSETFDKTLSAENLFLIQDEIAAAIVAALNTRLPVGDIVTSAAIESVAVETENIDAYENYLQARELFRERSSENLPIAIELLESSLQLDPTFARAWAGIAAVYSVAQSWGINDRDYDAMAIDAADEATRIDPTLPLPYSVRANAALQSADWELAKRENEMALKLGPNLAETHYFSGQLWQATGFHEKAISALERCLAIDPGYEICRRNIALELIALGRLEEAARIYEETLIAGQSSWDIMFPPVYAALGNTGALAQMLRQLYMEDAPELQWMMEPHFRWFTDDSYDEEQLAEELSVRYAMESRPYTLDQALQFGMLSVVLRRIDGVLSDLRFGSMTAFNYYVPEFWQSAERKQLIIAMKLPEYWQANGFPPRCRAVGDDDFHCD